VKLLVTYADCEFILILCTVTQIKCQLGSGHTESGLPWRAAIWARGGKAFELYRVRLHHPHQTEGGLTRRMSARLQFDGDDEVLHNTVQRPSRRGHRLPPVTAARFLCGHTLRLLNTCVVKHERM
jgi:hypothetical protein